MMELPWEPQVNGRPYTGKKYACTWVACEKRFWTKWSLDCHTRTHTGQRPFQCPLCEGRFTQSGNRDKHIRQMHPGSRNSKNEQRPTMKPRLFKSATLQPRVQKSEQPCWCFACDSRFGAKSALVRHVFDHDLLSHQRSYDGEHPFVCPKPKCGRRFSRRNTVDYHVKRQHMSAEESEQQKMFVCDWSECDQRFWLARDLASHLASHTGRKPFECRYCAAAYSRLYSLNHHHAITHPTLTPPPETERLFRTTIVLSCDWKDCHKKFIQQSDLKRHHRIHTGEIEKRYECAMCSAVFRKRVYLLSHIHRGHADIAPGATQAAKLNCCWPECNVRFDDDDELYEHESAHGDLPFRCEACAQGCRSKNSLQRHLYLRCKKLKKSTSTNASCGTKLEKMEVKEENGDKFKTRLPSAVKDAESIQKVKRSDRMLDGTKSDSDVLNEDEKRFIPSKSTNSGVHQKEEVKVTPMPPQIEIFPEKFYLASRLKKSKKHKESDEYCKANCKLEEPKVVEKTMVASRAKIMKALFLARRKRLEKTNRRL